MEKNLTNDQFKLSVGAIFLDNERLLNIFQSFVDDDDQEGIEAFRGEILKRMEGREA